MLVTTGRSPHLSATLEPAQDSILSSSGDGPQGAPRTGEDSKDAAQDTATAGWGDSKDEKGSSFLERVGKTFTWAPRKCRYDPDNPPKFSLALNLLFALVSPDLHQAAESIMS